MEWFYEEYQATKLGIKIKRVLKDEKSAFQQVTAMETEEHGKLLLIDGLVMLTERMEFVYHDMITHLPLYSHPAPKKVLIIGGGDGGSAREILKHPEVEHLDMVEIDEMVVNTCKEFQFCTATEFNNPRLNLMIQDGIKFMESQKSAYDVIIVDGSEPCGPSEGLFGKAFYQSVFHALKEDGILVAQTETPFYAPDVFADYVKVVHEIFPIVKPYLAFIPDYPSGMWSFTFASKKYDPIADFQEARYAKNSIKTRYYNKGIHQACFALPSFVDEMIK